MPNIAASTRCQPPMPKKLIPAIRVEIIKHVKKYEYYFSHLSKALKTLFNSLHLRAERRL